MTNWQRIPNQQKFVVPMTGVHTLVEFSSPTGPYQETTPLKKIKAKQKEKEKARVDIRQ